MDARDQHLDLQLRIAVNTGEALVSLGARPELGEAMVAGDVVNTASRLQSAAPVDGVIVGEETYAATRDAIEYEQAQPVDAKGKSAAGRGVARRPAPARRRRAAARQASSSGAPASSRCSAGSGSGGRRAVPHLVTVVGPAGIGKTRLAQEFERIVAELGGRSVRGRSLPYRESSAYFAFAMQVKQLCGIFESDSPEVALREAAASRANAVETSGDVARHLAILIGLDPGDRSTTARSCSSRSAASSSRRAGPADDARASRTSTGPTAACSTWSSCSAARLRDFPS